MRIIWIAVCIAVLLGVMAASVSIGGRKKLDRLNQEISGSWAQVENLLEKRYELIPNMVSILKGYAKEENELFEEYAAAKQLEAGAFTHEEKIRASNAMESFLLKFTVVAENYPQLKGNRNFMSLRDEVVAAQNLASVELRRYNDAVKQYNTTVSSFPANIIAKIYNFEPKENFYFNMADLNGGQN